MPNTRTTEPSVTSGITSAARPSRTASPPRSPSAHQLRASDRLNPSILLRRLTAKSSAAETMTMASLL
jgi:hypothetical protein